MNVLELYSSFFPKRGGVQTHIYDLSKCLLREGHQSVVLTWTPQSPSVELLNGIRVTRIRAPNFLAFTRYLFIFYLSLNIARIVRKYNIHVIHAHDYLPGLAAVLTGIFMHKPVITTFHLPIQKTTFYVPPRASPLFLVEKILKKLFIFWAEVICVSDFTYWETLKLGFKSSKMRIVYNWVTPKTKNAFSKCNTFKDLNLKGKRYVLSVGRLSEEQKQFSLLIKSFKVLIEKGYQIDLLIVGNGPEKNVYEKLIVKLKIEKRVHILNNVSDEILWTLYENCDHFVLTSRFEGLPLVILEAMNHSKPAVATKVGGVPEIIENEYNGLLVTSTVQSIYSAIEKLIVNPHLSISLGKNSKKTINKKFSNSNCAYTIKLLEKLEEIRGISRH